MAWPRDSDPKTIRLNDLSGDLTVAQACQLLRKVLESPILPSGIWQRAWPLLNNYDQSMSEDANHCIASSGFCEWVIGWPY